MKKFLDKAFLYEFKRNSWKMEHLFQLFHFPSVWFDGYFTLGIVLAAAIAWEVYEGLSSNVKAILQ